MRRRWGAVVCVKKKGMKEAWCLASGLERSDCGLRGDLHAEMAHFAELLAARPLLDKRSA